MIETLKQSQLEAMMTDIPNKDEDERNKKPGSWVPEIPNQGPRL